MNTPKRQRALFSDAAAAKRRKQILVIVIIVAICTVVALFATNIGRQYAGGLAARLTMGSRPVNILIIANNARGVRANDPLGLGSAAGQADVILLAHISPEDHTIYAITIPRDT